MTKYLWIGCCSLLGLLLAPAAAFGQSVPQDTAANQQVDVDHSDILLYIQEGDSVVQELIGNVELSQDSIYMYCDSAIIRNSNQVTATGEVLIQQGDSVSVFSDSLIYDGALRQADLYGNVVLINGRRKLFTDSLHYDLNTKIATYTSGAVLTDDSTQLSSIRGYYYVGTDEAFFKDSVVVIDEAFSLRADTLKFDTRTQTVFFLGPTLISGDSSRIYCEDGFYDTKNEKAEFRQRAQFVKGAQKGVADTIAYDGAQAEYTLAGNARFVEEARRATADVIRYREEEDKTLLIGNARYRDGQQDIAADRIEYDARNEVYSTRGRSRISDPPQLLEADQVDYGEEAGMGAALGNVIWRDTSSELTIFCERADYNRETDYLKASGGRRGRPLLIILMEGDSLFMASDTLQAMRADTVSEDSSRLLLAYHDVRVYKSDLQALCDSLTYNSADSIFQFFQQPLIWSDTTQFSADTIYMQMANDQIDQVFLRERSFIINSPDELFFNQIKGKNIVASFEEDELRRMDVNGNAESVYYARDELGAYVGVNKTICSDMLLYFGDNQVERIKFFAQPQAKLHPMRQVDHESLKIEGFDWQNDVRPKNRDDLFAPLSRKPAPPAAPEVPSARPKPGAADREEEPPALPPGIDEGRN